MPNIGAPELIIILVIALLILGPGKLPEVGASIGKSIREFRKASTDVQDAVKVNVDTSPLPTPVSSAPVASAAPAEGAPSPPPVSTTDPNAATKYPTRQPPTMADADALREAGAPALPAGPGQAAPPPVAAPTDDTVMSLVDHLGELRTRLFRSILAVAVGSIVGFYFGREIRNFLIEPLPMDSVQVLGLGDAFAIQLRIAIVTGIILAMPVLLYQIWAFVAPGLTPNERKSVRPWIPLALLFFALGVGIAYFVLPYAASFLLGFTDEVLVANIAAGPYFDFVTTMFLAFGLVLEFPILLVGLSRVGILSSERLTASRRFVILGIAIFSAVATPGGDLVSPVVLGGTMYLLFELTVLFIKRSGK